MRFNRSGSALVSEDKRFWIARGVDLRGKTEWTATDRATGAACSSNLLRLMRAWCADQPAPPARAALAVPNARGGEER